MILPYEFDNANLDGDKEAVIVPAVPTLINKLSANEANGIKDKLNEIIDVGQNNFTNIAYLELRLKFKGVVGGVPNSLSTLQPGDIVHGFADADTIWTNAIYEGGDITDRNNYTPIYDPKPAPEMFTAPITGAGQTFILPTGFKAGSVLKSRGELYIGTEWSQTDDILTIIVSANAGNSIYVKPA